MEQIQTGMISVQNTGRTETDRNDISLDHKKTETYRRDISVDHKKNRDIQEGYQFRTQEEQRQIGGISMQITRRTETYRKDISLEHRKNRDRQEGYQFRTQEEQRQIGRISVQDTGRTETDRKDIMQLRTQEEQRRNISVDHKKNRDIQEGWNTNRTQSNNDDIEDEHKQVEHIKTGRISRWNKGRTGMDMEEMEHLQNCQGQGVYPFGTQVDQEPEGYPIIKSLKPLLISN